MTSTTIPPQVDEAFLRKLSDTLDGVSIAEALSGLTSAILLVILQMPISVDEQTQVTEAVCMTMRDKLAAARTVSQTGTLAN